MYLRKTFNKKTGRTYLSIVHNYRDKDSGVTKSHIVRSLGYVDELEKEYPDPISHFTDLAKKMEEERRREHAPLTFRFDPSAEIDSSKYILKNIGYIPLQRIYRQLSLSDYMEGLARRTEGLQNTDNTLQQILYRYLLYGKYQSQDTAEDILFWPGPPMKESDIYINLITLVKNRITLQYRINDSLRDLGLRKNDQVYYHILEHTLELDSKGWFQANSEVPDNLASPLLRLGIFIDSDGIPIHYEFFSGQITAHLPFQTSMNQIKKEFYMKRILTVLNSKFVTDHDLYSLLQSGNPYLLKQSFSEDYLLKHPELLSFLQQKSGYKTKNGLKRKSQIAQRVLHYTNANGELEEYTVTEKHILYFDKELAKYSNSLRENIMIKVMNFLTSPKNFSADTIKDIEPFIQKIVYGDDGQVDLNSSILDVNWNYFREQECWDGYILLTTNDLKLSEDKAYEIFYRNRRIDDAFRLRTKNLLKRPDDFSTKEAIETQFLLHFLCMILERLLERSLNDQYSSHEILKALQKATCMYLDDNLYMLHFCNEILTQLGKLHGIPYWRRGWTAGEIRQFLNA